MVAYGDIRPQTMVVYLRKRSLTTVGGRLGVFFHDHRIRNPFLVVLLRIRWSYTEVVNGLR